IILDTQVNQTWTAVNTDKDYNILNPKSMKMFRLNISANNGNTSFLAVNELKMFEEKVAQTIVKLPSKNESDFINYGIDYFELQNLKFADTVSRIKLIKDDLMPLDSGNTFIHIVDLNKYEGKKIKFQ
ncbi:hypothetical protein ACFVRU_29810, partial [Streptomyces sp. NPDC057927]